MLEQVRVAGFAGFDFIARSGIDDDIHRDDVRESGRDGDQAESVGQFLLGVGERENLLGSVGSQDAGHAGQQ